MRHCKRLGYQSLKTIDGEKAITRFKNCQNLILQIDKVDLDRECLLTDVSHSSILNRFKEHKTITDSYAHVQRDSSNTLQFVEVFEALAAKDCMSAAMTALTKTNKQISQFLGCTP